MKILPVILLSLMTISLCQSAKILAVFNSMSYSHHILIHKLLEELSHRDHDITMITPHAKEDVNPNYKIVHLDGYIQAIIESFKNSPFTWESISKNSELTFVKFALDMSLFFSNLTLHNPNLKKLLKEESHFDLVIVEQSFNEPLKGICHYYKAPCVAFSSVGASIRNNYLVGNPSPTSYIPEQFLKYSSHMTFFQRLSNTLFHYFYELYFYLFIMPYDDAILHEHFPDAPYIGDLITNVSIVLLNSHVSSTHPIPLVPNMIEIGGIHVTPPKNLPEDLKSILDNATEGAVYFSLGTNVKSSMLNKNNQKILMRTLGKLNKTVLWKFETDDIPGKSDNVYIRKWFPQQDILAHPNVELFVTHGGLLSTIEAIYHGKPVIGIPFMGDQHMNMARTENSGFGITFSYADLSEKNLLAAFEELFNNPKYAINAKKRSAIMHDRPMKPLDTAVFWVEYVLRHNGAYHLRTAAIDLKWYQHYLLDVVLFLFISVATSVFLIVKTFKFVFCRKCKKIDNSKKTN